MKNRKTHPAGRLTTMAGLVAVALMISSPAHAQLSTATVKGQITISGAPAKASQVTATNKASGYTYKATSGPDGSYVLTGLAPGTYDITVAGKSQTITLSVGETAAVDLALTSSSSTATMDTIVVTSSALRADVKTSEVGTNVSRTQIENLPQVTRNFLSFADLAPGVRFDVSQNTGQVKIQSGAQNQDNVNVFIDGVSQKNYVLRGGVAGMDSTRGNPFPQSAVAEYKIVSQNYKAEFDQVSSVAISAVTKSGTNEFHGDVFWDRTSDSMTAKDPFQKKAEAQGIPRPAFHQDQFGFTLGGPISVDRAHFFMAYEGKDIVQPRQVVLQNANLLPAGGIVPSLRAQEGNQDATFKEHLWLGKIDAQLNQGQRVELSARVRRENDYVPEDALLSIAENSKDRRNDETRVDFKHEWSMDSWLNEARIGYSDTVFNPHAKSNTPQIRYLISPSNSANNTKDVLQVGGSPDAQTRGQNGVLFQDDLTFTGMLGHTMKFGAKVNLMTFDLSGTAKSVPIYKALIDNVTGATTIIETQNAITPASVSIKDKQFGIYFQDDWQISRQLELNLGIRWDYETNMLNEGYATPADRVTALRALDAERYGIAPPPGQTYAQSLAKGGININDYISNGSSRKDFKGALQPRLGFSYDVFGDRNSVVYGGYGRAYDRTMDNHALDEKQKNEQPNGEIWLIKNDHKMAYTDQFSLGLRQGLGIWNGEVGYNYSYSHNQFNWYGGNRDANGGFANQSPIDPLWGGPVGYGTLILGDFISQAKTESLFLKADKPYSKVSGWGLTAVFTLSEGKTTNRQWTNDIFNWTYGKSTAGWNPSVDVERSRLVVAGLTDRLIPWGVMLSGKASFGSGLPYQITDCSRGWDKCVYQKGESSNFKQFDLGLAKDFDIYKHKLTLRLDVLNLFDTINYGGRDGWAGGPGNSQNQYGGDNPNVGTPNGMSGPMRTYKLSFRASF
ncbi:MAG: TonB-dependent receptor [Betaproteobacteria bacterium]|nr:TonB-dependent receptor [Betaproteobacteria bacterium]